MLKIFQSHSSKNELNLEILNAIDFLKTLLSLTETPRSVLEEIIPAELLDQSDYLMTIATSN